MAIKLNRNTYSGGGGGARATSPAKSRKTPPSVAEVVEQLKVVRSDARALRSDSESREPFRLDVQIEERTHLRRALAPGELAVGTGDWVIVGGHVGSPSVYSNTTNAGLEAVARELIACTR